MRFKYIPVWESISRRQFGGRLVLGPFVTVAAFSKTLAEGGRVVPLWTGGAERGDARLTIMDDGLHVRGRIAPDADDLMTSMADGKICQVTLRADVLKRAGAIITEVRLKGVEFDTTNPLENV